MSHWSTLHKGRLYKQKSASQWPDSKRDSKSDELTTTLNRRGRFGVSVCETTVLSFRKDVYISSTASRSIESSSQCLSWPPMCHASLSSFLTFPTNVAVACCFCSTNKSTNPYSFGSLYLCWSTEIDSISFNVLAFCSTCSKEMRHHE